jgi:hypothetical protein
VKADENNGILTVVQLQQKVASCECAPDNDPRDMRIDIFGKFIQAANKF